MSKRSIENLSTTFKSNGLNQLLDYLVNIIVQKNLLYFIKLCTYIVELPHDILIFFNPFIVTTTTITSNLCPPPPPSRLRNKSKKGYKTFKLKDIFEVL